ncbi:MAG: choice-of-anchor M domain-containing protein [Planctomycetota bacterium]
MRMHLVAWMATIVLSLGSFSVAEAGIWASGHGDIDAHFHDGELEVGLHFHSGAKTLDGQDIPEDHYEADAYQIFVPGASTPRPSGAIWDFAGNAGEQLWFLPDQSDQNKPYLGWGAEELAEDGYTAFTFTLLSVNGPDGGIFSVYSLDSSGENPTFKLSSSTLAGAPKSFGLGLGHEHYFVAFNREGRFDVTLKFSATQTSSSQVFEGQGTFTFFSGSVPSGEVPEPATMTVFAAFALGAGYRMKRRKKLATS